MTRMRFLLPLALVLAASCSSGGQTAGPTGAPSPGPTGTRIGDVYRVETANLVVDYPASIDPVEASQHAATLQQAYDAFRVIFAFDDEPPFGGEKTPVILSLTSNQTSLMGNKILIGRGVTSVMEEGYVNPPSPTFFHEMTHLFAYAQYTSGRHYFYWLMDGFNEGLADYMTCHPDIFKLWDNGAQSQGRCDLLLHGVGAKPMFRGWGFDL